MSSQDHAQSTNAAPVMRAAPKGYNGKSAGRSDEWYTPAFIFDALGAQFDMDAASPGQFATPWIPAREFLTWGSLERPWSGFIWMNPPFGKRNAVVPWLEKFFAHGNGVALLPDSTATPWWQVYARRAGRILFIGKTDPVRGDPSKVRFISGEGRCNKSPAHGTTLFAAGALGVAALERAAVAGLGLLTTPQVSPAIRDEINKARQDLEGQGFPAGPLEGDAE